MTALILVAVSLIVGLAWAVIDERRNRDKPFDTEVAGITITYDPTTKVSRLHEHPTSEQLAIITAWLADPRQPRRPRVRILERLWRS